MTSTPPERAPLAPAPEQTLEELFAPTPPSPAAGTSAVPSTGEGPA